MRPLDLCFVLLCVPLVQAFVSLPLKAPDGSLRNLHVWKEQSGRVALFAKHAKGFSSSGERAGKKAQGVHTDKKGLRQESKIVRPEDLLDAASNLFLIFTQIQKTELYSPRWADAAEVSKKDSKLVASRNVDEGEIVSLYPMHGLGVHGVSNDKGRKEHFVFDADLDSKFFGAIENGAPSSEQRCDVPVFDEENLFARTLGKQHAGLFIDANPTRRVQGWLGHLANGPDGHAPSNVVVVPLKGAEPLCGLVATSPIACGDEIRRQQTPTDLLDLARKTAQRYACEIAELRSYVSQAYPATSSPQDPSLGASSEGFYRLNESYPSLEALHRDPDILVIPHFLTAEECDRLIAKASPHLSPCLTKHPRTGVVEQDPTRTSSNANVPRPEAPSVVRKITSLASCTEEQLETLQILRYENGQEFQRHTDGFEGAVTACGFEKSGRLATVFCYLNDVERGGETLFPQLDLSVRPSKGTAVVHFPTSLNFVEDRRTEHVGSPAVDDKWLLVTWVWAHARTDPRYGEELEQPLSNDVI